MRRCLSVAAAAHGAAHDAARGGVQRAGPVDAREQENQLLKTKLMEVSDALQQALEKQRVDQRRSKVPMKEAEAAYSGLAAVS